MTSPVLDALGPIPSTLITLDFETFFSTDYTLRNLTTEAYVRDPRFETIGVGVKYGNKPSVWMEDSDFRGWAKRVDWNRVAVLAHHAHFDGLVLSERYGIRPGFWYDTLSMGRALHGTAPGNGLEGLALKYGVGAKGKELENARGKRRRDFTAAEWLAFGVYCNNDNEIARQILDRMLVGFPVEELWLIDTTIRMFTEPSFTADQAVLDLALSGERAKKKAVLTRVAQMAGVNVPDGASVEETLEAARSTLSSSDKFAALLRSMGEVAPLKPNKKGENIYAFAKSDPGMQVLLEHEDDEIRALAEARLAVKSTIIETRTERLMGIGRRGRVPFYLKYCGAHTHRWSGGDKMNPQNFNRGGALRAAICADCGEVLVVADSGQIEARKVAWVAREERLLETFRRNDAKTAVYKAALAQRIRSLGHEPSKAERKRIDAELGAEGIEDGDFYSDVGSQFFGKKLSKEETPVERQTSKSMVLGLGFGMGWGKFACELLKGMLGAPPVQFGHVEAARYHVDVGAFAERPHGRDGPPCGDKVRDIIAFGGARIPYAALLVHCAVTDHFVRLYRSTNPRIAGLWTAMGVVLRVMASNEGGAERGRYGPLTILRHGLRKPNGLVMHYPGLRRTADGYAYLGGKSGKEMTKVYGGLLAENVVQSLARDVVAEQALWVRSAGYRLGTTTHDEIVAVVPEAQGEACLADMLRIMRTPPAWCADLPLNASGGFARSYGAVK